MDLSNSNRFSVIEYQPKAIKTKDVAEQASLAIDDGKEKIEPKEGQIKTSDLVLSASVVNFQPQTSGGRAGVGGGGGVGSGVLGSLSEGVLNKAHIDLDIRILDSSGSEIIAETRVQGQASDIKIQA